MGDESKAPASRLERMTAQEEFRDYCLWEYTPLAAHAGKFRSVNLLFHTFELAEMPSRAFELVGAVRDGIGIGRTVWGVKWRGGVLGWELYFYDYRRRERERSISRLQEILRPFAASPVRVNENLPYFMFSLDIDRALVLGERALDEVHMYIGNVGSSVSSGICYSLTPAATRLENFYFFFDARKQTKEIAAKAACSAYLDAFRIPMDQLLWPELRDCRVIVVANKQTHDAVYFSGIDVNQLLVFLRRMEYPAPLVRFVEEHRPSLDHLQYDVGIDYRMEDGKLVFLKSGYYGIF
jgi:hypothetical protein